MTHETRDDELSGLLARSVAVLRDEVPVRPDWRTELLTRIDSDRRAAAGWRLRPMWAIAAGIALLAGGVAIGRSSRAASPEVAHLANVRFVLLAPGASTVSVVGDFNQWNANALPMRRLSDGTWIVDVPIDPGRYAYAFVVDGKIVIDPAAPRAESEFGENSILMVRGS